MQERTARKDVEHGHVMVLLNKVRKSPFSKDFQGSVATAKGLYAGKFGA